MVFHYYHRAAGFDSEAAVGVAALEDKNFDVFVGDKSSAVAVAAGDKNSVVVVEGKNFAEALAEHKDLLALEVASVEHKVYLKGVYLVTMESLEPLLLNTELILRYLLLLYRMN